MAVRRRRTSTNRSGSIKLKQSAALQHNRKLARRHLGGARKVSAADARIDRAKKYNRRRQHRRNTGGGALLGLFKNLDPTTWWKAKPSR